MVDLSTTYMGLSLRNPLIVGSSGLVKTVEGVQKAADAGAGAVVLKSLFEEQLQAQTDEIDRDMMASAHTEALEYVRAEIGMSYGVGEYTQLIRQCKRSVSIPVIASINCVSPRWWTQYAEQIAAAGPDALELNISRMPVDPSGAANSIEEIFYSIVEDVTRRIELPVAVKIGPYFTSLANFAAGLIKRGASALVLFNRFYRPDIDVDSMQAITASPFSTPEEISISLRWIALLAGRLPCDFASSTGVHDHIGLIKQLLAGASAVQACSTFYIHGFQQIETMLKGLEDWMEAKGLNRLEEIPIQMQPNLTSQPELFERLQYIKLFGGIE